MNIDIIPHEISWYADADLLPRASCLGHSINESHIYDSLSDATFKPYQPSISRVTEDGNLPASLYFLFPVYDTFTG